MEILCFYMNENFMGSQIGERKKGRIELRVKDNLKTTKVDM